MPARPKAVTPVRPARRRSARWVVATLLAAVVIGAAIYGVRALRPARASTGVTMGRLPFGIAQSDLNLLIITLDTTRADRIGAYGFNAVETPNLDRLARDGVLFEQTASVAPITLPAHTSMFTGMYPPEHGVRDNGGFFLDPKQTTLAELLAARGFTTGAFVGAYVLDSRWGLDQGFQTYEDDFDFSKVTGFSVGSIQRPGNEVADRALKWLDKVGSSRFFGWLHFYDPHSPYEPPEPYRTMYAQRPYAGEIAYVDAQIGRVLSFLEERRLLDRTIVLAIGDHGESLGDHGEATHAFFIYESVTRVPFIIRAPFGLMRGRRVADMVRSVDVMPTVLDLLGVPPPKETAGTSLAPLMTGQERTLRLEAYAEAMYPLHHFGWSDLRSLRAGRFKVIAAPKPELYDLQDDPNERRNVYADRGPLGERMLARLQQIEQGFEQSSRAARPADEVDPEVRARLAALGYVGNFVASIEAGRDRGTLADPKDKIELFNLMSSAREVSKDGDSEEAIRRLVRVTREDPNVIDAWFALGNEYFKNEKLEEAIEHFKRALALKPDYDLAVINLANSYRRLGRPDAAIAGFERYLELDPKNAYVRYQLGELYMDKGELERADRDFRQALALDSQLAAARNALGVVALKRGDLPTAEREIRGAIEMKPDVRLAHFNLALIAESRGRFEEARREYEAEIALHPDTYKAYFNLGRLYERLGDRPRQLESFKAAIEKNPQFAEGHLYLAKLYLDMGQQLDQAAALARKGLELDPRSEFAPLGHYIMADVYNRQGRPALAAQEAARGRLKEMTQGRRNQGRSKDE